MTNQISGPLQVSHMLVQLQSVLSYEDSFHPRHNAVLRGNRTNHLVTTGTLSLPLRARLQELNSSLPLRQRLGEVVEQLGAPGSSLCIQTRLLYLRLDRNAKLQLPNKGFFL